MIDYINLEIPRERPDYPTGLKHFRKDEVFEASLFEYELTKQKVKGIVKGAEDGKEDIARHQAESGKDAQEIL